MQKCQAAGVQVQFGEDHVPPGHHEVVRRLAAPSKGGAVSRDVAGSMLGLVAAVAAAAAL